ncbi:MAG TPA: hypothetical protein VL986_08095 [Terracidiphilus sp.]|nr:hypothetical protein [Terracidiphilus sp.]
MRIPLPLFTFATLAAAALLPAKAQAPATQPDPTAIADPAHVSTPAALPVSAPAAAPPVAIPVAGATASLPVTPAMQLLLGFKDSDVKFALSDLMDILRDRRHEGWVLAAYPDPKTSHPLIGAGFSLDLPAREHAQTDSLNPNPFIEPSSAEEWRAAGLDGARLDAILDRFNERMKQWKKKGFRRRMTSLEPDISDDDANLLLRIAIIQSIENAKAYCRNFDALTASQQMAMSQLVYQIGFNLQHFTQFLAQINSDAAAEASYWGAVQSTLEHSQWAHLYRIRATAVIAQLDPVYADDPAAAEKRVGAVLRPAVAHRRRGHTHARTELASSSPTAHSGHGHARHGKTTRGHARQAA